MNSTLNCFVTAAKPKPTKHNLQVTVNCIRRCCVYSVTDPNLDTNDVICVELLKASDGLGFSLDGGKASIAGDRPLLVQIFKGTTSMQMQWILSQFSFCALYKHFNSWTQCFLKQGWGLCPSFFTTYQPKWSLKKSTPGNGQGLHLLANICGAI